MSAMFCSYQKQTMWRSSSKEHQAVDSLDLPWTQNPPLAVCTNAQKRSVVYLGGARHVCPLFYFHGVLSDGFNGCGRDARPPGGPNSFKFMQFWGKFGKIVCWRPLPGEFVAPPQGNSGSVTGFCQKLCQIIG